MHFSCIYIQLSIEHLLRILLGPVWNTLACSIILCWQLGTEVWWWLGIGVLATIQPGAAWQHLKCASWHWCQWTTRFQTPVWIVNMKWCTCMRDESFRLSDSFQELSNFEDGMLGTLTCDQPGLEGGILKETIGSEALNACPIHQLRMVVFPNYLSKVL